MDRICVLDFGAQYAQLIASRVRELSVYSEILPCTEPVEKVLAAGYKGIILSGGPSSVYDDGAPLPDKRLFEAGIPVLGICYGMQAMGYLLGGEVVPAERREYGPADLLLEGDIRYRLGPLRSKSRQKAQSRNRLESSREMAACRKLNLNCP